MTNHVHFLVTPGRWASHALNARGDLSWLTPHPEYQRPGSTPVARGFAYRDLFKAQLSEEDLHLVRKAAHYCQPIGEDRLRKPIERR
jgi:hypothetical protein